MQPKNDIMTSANFDYIILWLTLGIVILARTLLVAGSLFLCPRHKCREHIVINLIEFVKNVSILLFTHFLTHTILFCIWCINKFNSFIIILLNDFLNFFQCYIEEFSSLINHIYFFIGKGFM